MKILARIIIGIIVACIVCYASVKIFDIDLQVQSYITGAVTLGVVTIVGEAFDILKK